MSEYLLQVYLLPNYQKSNVLTFLETNLQTAKKPSTKSGKDSTKRPKDARLASPCHRKRQKLHLQSKI